MAQDHFYEPLSLFQLRAPLMPLSAYEELSDSLTRLAQNPIVREAILVSSRSLFNSLDYIADDTQERKRQQVMRGVWRYANRMITRPTPFGLFAGVTIGTFGEKTALRLQAPETFGKRTRPDMEWLSKVVQKLEHTPAILRQLHVQTNPLVQRVGNRVQVAFAQDVDAKTRGAGNAPSIRSTWVVEAILEAAQSWMSFDQLVALILEQEPSAPEEKITQLLTVLCRHEFLITSLRLPLTNSQPFDHLRTVLASVNGIVPLQERLERIAELIRLYDQQPPGDGIEAYDAIVREMKQLEEVKDMLQVDLRLEAGEAVLPHDLGQEVAKAAECVWRLSTRSTGFEHLESYRTAFRERYGTEREVPLLELLDEYKGLGAPATYEMPRSRMQVSPLPSSVKAQRDSLLLQLVSECIRDGRQELVLDEEQVRKLTVRQRTTDQAPLSQEVFVRLSAVSAEAVDRGDYLLHMGRMSSMTAGKSFGRFADLLGDAHHRLADEIQCREQLLQPEVEFAEILHRPAIGRFMNIALTSHARTHEISLGAPSLKAPEQVIQPDDLLVGCTDNAFYLRSKRSGRIVIPTATHMLTTKGSPNVYRFLRELAFEGKGLLESFSWGSLERAP
ncbi:MAG: lantibiotic dehydratase family protein, partial [Tumebacillaceae bacterium]